MILIIPREIGTNKPLKLLPRDEVAPDSNLDSRPEREAFEVPDLEIFRVNLLRYMKLLDLSQDSRLIL